MPEIETLTRFFPESFVLMRPLNIVSGDFYWFHQRRQKFFVVAADCTGHGVPGGFMSVMGINLLNSLIEERGITDAASILEELDFEIETRLNQKGEGALSKDGMDIAIAVFDFRLHTMQFAGAMRPAYLLSNGSLVEIKGDRHPIGGAMYDLNNFTNHKIELSPGDTVYLFSDGFTDQFGGDDIDARKFTNKRFQRLLIDIHTFDMKFQLKLLQDEFEKWKRQHEQLDDVLVLGLRYPANLS